MTVSHHTTDKALKYFYEKYGQNPEWTIIAPGRVNLIGEHTDYNLLPVLPMAIERSIVICARPAAEPVVRITNINSEFPESEIPLDRLPEPVPGHWSNYIRAAVHSVMTYLQEQEKTVRGFEAIIDSDLPPAAGLSSSSALVIGSCLALLRANGVSWSMDDVANRMRVAEQFVGTAGGGMDQAIISLAQQGSALMIEFDPLVPTPVNLPDNVSVFIIDSGQKAEKTGTARHAYNQRTVTCELAVMVLRQAAADELDTSGWKTLRDVYRGCQTAGLAWSELLLRHLPVAPVTPAGLEQVLSREQWQAVCQSRNLPLDNLEEWLPGGVFQLYSRAAHVLGESDRVYQFKTAMENNDLPEAFRLANASYASCRDLYHISTPEIENLVLKARNAGAGSARITGAGFGGCIVAMVETTLAHRFRAEMEAHGIPPERIIETGANGPARYLGEVNVSHNPA